MPSRTVAVAHTSFQDRLLLRQSESVVNRCRDQSCSVPYRGRNMLARGTYHLAQRILHVALVVIETMADVDWHAIVVHPEQWGHAFLEVADDDFDWLGHVIDPHAPDGPEPPGVAGRPDVTLIP